MERRWCLAGVMSGTSLDGVDVALAEFWCESGAERFRLLGWRHWDFPAVLRQRLLRLQEEPIPIGEVAELHWELAALMADCVRQTCAALQFPLHRLDGVGMHGQTVYHNPGIRHGRGYGVGLQLGNLSAVAQWLGVPVVGDFRSADLAHGGEGAPLVPLFDWAFLRSEQETVAALNLGGIANVTVLPAGCTPEQVRAWDTGPGNVWIDAAAELYGGFPYDAEGACARTGELVPALWEALQSIAFVRQPPPKSTGREEFSRQRLRELVEQSGQAGAVPADILHTLTRFTAWSIAENLRRFAAGVERLIVSGGGAFNSFLLECLQRELPHVRLERSDDVGIPVQAKEALCFAYLAYRTLEGRVGNLPSVTGARRAVVLGVVAQPGEGRAA